MEILYRIICVVAGYGFGLIETGYIVGKIKGVNLQQHGSGNTGTTNALRVMGKGAAAVVFLGDILKAIIWCTIIRLIFTQTAPDMVGILVLYGGFGVVMGHNYPFYMHFKGGKGIAATSGMIIAFGDYRIILILLAAFILTTAITRYVSLGSLVIVTGFFICMVLFGTFGHVGMPGAYVSQHHLMESYILSFLFAVSAFYKHRENIKRLLNGTERKLGEHED